MMVKKYYIGVAILGIVIMGFTIVGYSFQGQSLEDAKIIHYTTWQGGDVQTFSNVTLSAHGITKSIILNCNYFYNSTNVAVWYWPHGSLSFGPDITIAKLPYGCVPQR